MTETSASQSDIPKGNWVDRWVPSPARPYARLARFDRPIGTWLLLLPCWWGTALAATVVGEGADFLLFALFGFGALVMRGAGCVFNDWTDRDFDARVARTADRPIPSGAVSPNQALLFMAGLMLLGLLVALALNSTAQIVAICSLVLIFPYPFMKRITYWPQAWLGLTFNWGALVSWAAVTGELTAPALFLYAAGFFWTLGYDTIYAHQDKEDDALIGVKSTALKFGARTRVWLAGFYGVTILLLAAAGLSAGVAAQGGLAAVFFWSALAAAAVQLAWQVVDVDTDDPADCMAKFKSNRWTGLIVTAGISAASYV